jgi:hypothetical protein
MQSECRAVCILISTSHMCSIATHRAERTKECPKLPEQLEVLVGWDHAIRRPSAQCSTSLSECATTLHSVGHLAIFPMQCVLYSCNLLWICRLQVSVPLLANSITDDQCKHCMRCGRPSRLSSRLWLALLPRVRHGRTQRTCAKQERSDKSACCFLFFDPHALMHALAYSVRAPRHALPACTTEHASARSWV